MPPTQRVTWLLSLSLVAACGDETPHQPLDARLAPMASCTEAKAHVRKIALARMNAEIDRKIATYRRGEYCPANRGWGEDASDAPTAGGIPPTPTGPSQGTGTNNQVAGVDEADFVKNDGRYIYLAQNGVLRIVSSWPADQTHEVSVTPIEGTPKKLFVAGDRALVYVSVGKPGDATTGWRRSECTYGYDCDFTGDGTPTNLLVFDISDRAAPELIRQVGLSGSLIAGRRIGTAVHTVVTQAASLFPTLAYDPEGDLCGYVSGFSSGAVKPPLAYAVAAKRAWDQLRAANARIIETADLDLQLPAIADSATPDADPSTTACASLFASALQDGTAFTSIVSLDLADPGPVRMSTIISRAGAVYASADALYLAVGHNYEGEDVSTVHKFSISSDPHDTKYRASGAVPGRALNQFAMDEQDDLLRIATTTGHVPSPDVVSQLLVLAQDGGELVKIGHVDNIAPTEDIRSVRFDGDRAFVVTFKKTDPLFAFDLSDPTNPRKLGELKIPGFSTYMHMLDDDHLLTIGYDADDHGSFAFFDGVLLQIFDVSNPAQPALAHKYVIGTRGSSSEALTNHLAFTWYPEQALLSIPMTLCEGGDDGQYGTTMTFSGLMIFDAGVAAGFAEHGRVAHPVSTGITCGNWWTDAESVVRRSLFLEDFVYSISDAHLKVRSIHALATPLVDLDL